MVIEDNRSETIEPELTQTGIDSIVFLVETLSVLGMFLCGIFLIVAPLRKQKHE